jgi:DNA-binding MarR family transcriptional regulator
MSDIADSALSEFNLDGFTTYKIAMAAQVLSQALAAVYAPHGLSNPEWRILAHLVHTHGASVRDIQNDIVMEKSIVSRTTSRLEGRGLVEKTPHPTDRRLIGLALTGQGRALMTRIVPEALAFQNDIAARLGADLPPLDALLDRVIGLYR